MFMKQENMLVYEKFVEAVAIELEQRLQQSVQVVEVVKNNDVTLIALEIMKEGINVAPIIYMTPYYKVYCEFGLEKVVELLLEAYQAYEPKENLETDILFDKREFCSRLRMKVVHYESNQKQLENVPYIPFLDLAITFCLLLDMQEHEVGTIRITKQYMKHMKISVEELYANALENMETDYQFISLYKAIEPMKEADTEFPQIEQELYVLTTYSRVGGASLMLHKGILKKFMEEKQMERIIIIPSSIHEVIVMFYESDMDILGLNEMIQEVNRTALDATEVLSQHAYLFDGENYMICP